MKKIIITVALVVVVVLTVVLVVKNNKPIPPVPVVEKPVDTATLKDGRQCYVYNHDATTTEPYAVNEFIDVTVSGTRVVGTKRGTQKGPDMTNGYTGTITGTLDKDTLTDVFSYVIEDSPNKEKEIYKARVDQIGIEKLRYPLKEEGKMLVPDITKAFTSMLYSRVGCTASN